MTTASAIWRNFGAMIESLSQVDRQFPVILLYGDPATILPDEVNEAFQHAGNGRVIIIHSREVTK